MPEQISQEFSDAILEADMRRLAAEVVKARELPENRNTPEKELLKQSLRASASTASQPTTSLGTESPLPAAIQGAPAEVKLEIEYLVDLALHRGLQKANEAATKSDPFVLDAFHDMLAGKLYPELQKRGLLK